MKKLSIMEALALGLVCLPHACAQGLSHDVVTGRGEEEISLQVAPKSDEALSLAGRGWRTSTLREVDRNGGAPAAAAEKESSADDAWNCKWETGILYDYVRFRSSIIKADMNGIETSFAYRVKRYFGLEGDARDVFGSPIFANEHKNLAFIGGGVQLAFLVTKWRPYVHADFGGVHRLPQTAGNSQWSPAMRFGAGDDYRLTREFSVRVGMDYLGSKLYSQEQSNLQMRTGLFFHF